MQGYISIDLTVCASKEAKICLNCDRKRCTPNECERYDRMKAELKQTTPKRKNLKNREEKSKCED